MAEATLRQRLLHDVAARGFTAASGERFSVGGRVLDVLENEGKIVLADAFGALAFAAASTLLANDRVRAGDLLLASVVWDETPTIETFLHHARPDRDDGSSDWLRLSTRGVGHGLQRRALALGAVRRWFAEQGFLEVETPVAVPSPGLDPHLEAVAADDAFLITSPEYQMKRLVSGGIFRCWQLARCHRRDESGALHNPEFTMLEWYRGFADVEDVMADTEALVVAVVAAVAGSPRLTLGDRTLELARPFARLTVRDAFARFADTDEATMLRLANEDEGTFFELLVTLVEPALAAFDVPVFLCEFPAPQASLARRKPGDPRYAERFELYVAGVELCNGFGELVDPIEQRARLLADQGIRRERGAVVYPIDERFLAALEHGMPPSAGNALGFDRLVALACGLTDIRLVQAFPSDVL